MKPIHRRLGGFIRRLKPQDWLRHQKRDFVLCIGRQLAVVSEYGRAPKGMPVLYIPAGMAFGTGEHATTALCLRQLAGAIRLRTRTGQAAPRLLDAGTGSGILALAASALGARVEAFDSDPACLQECRANASRNADVPKVQWRPGNVLNYLPRHTADVVVANLFAGLLLQALPRMVHWMAPGGLLILSGILRDQEAEVIQALARLRWPLRRSLHRGRWVCLVASAQSDI